MKPLFVTSLFLFFTSVSFAQENTVANGSSSKNANSELNLHEETCFFSNKQISKKGEINYLKTEALMVDELTTPVRGRLIDFSLIRTKEHVLLEVSIQEDAEEAIYPICIGAGAKLKLYLQDGTNLELPQFGAKKCGSRNVESDTYYNVTNQGFFLISEEHISKLRKNEVYLAEFSSKSYSFSFVFRSELYDEVNDIFIYPELYFIAELNCILNPAFK